ncbi:DUF2634 domain-containing protein [Paenibacillus sp. MAH-36]|uniref:DUF2634 domain-containing protein n=1 Tax=Paenibacillus violae TaxID=3077234 RepID=A0ABU3RHT5_9BACL|nr:DUF2634 domain-containing protein [Paenibacillus sp. PFR10]MDU0203828.1 DUF2634 domain-containing protein [Paenibacillus sp. PFR10]
MPNLFPLAGTEKSELPLLGAGTGRGAVGFGRCPKFDYALGEFVLTQTGRIAECSGTEAWLQWCQKALLTQRYTYLAYSRAYGQEFDDLIARQLSKPANEMEITRITKETLMVDPRTASVGPFTWTWNQSECSFQCQITNVRGDKKNIQGSVVIS